MGHKKSLLLTSIFLLVCLGISWSSTRSCILYNRSYAFSQNIQDFTQTEVVSGDDLVEVAINRVKNDLARRADVKPSEISLSYLCDKTTCQLISMYIVVYVDDAKCPLKQPLGNAYNSQIVEFRISPEKNKVLAQSLVGETGQTLPAWENIPIKANQALDIALELFGDDYKDDQSFLIGTSLISDSWTLYLKLNTDPQNNANAIELYIDYQDGHVLENQR
jgi:hypothetical protein